MVLGYYKPLGLYTNCPYMVAGACLLKISMEKSSMMSGAIKPEYNVNIFRQPRPPIWPWVPNIPFFWPPYFLQFIPPTFFDPPVQYEKAVIPPFFIGI